MAAEMQLPCIIRTILIDALYTSISVICCDLELHMLHHSFRRLQSWANPAADSASVDSIPSGGLDFIIDGESICKQQKFPHIALTHGMRDWRLKQMHGRNTMWLLKDYLCLQDACKCCNFLFLWFRVHSWNGGRWPFELLEKYETAASVWLPATLLLWTQIETAINLSEKKISLL